MTGHEPCGELVARTGTPDEACLRAAAHHVSHDLWLLRHAWNDQALRVGWTLWFISARSLMDFFFVPSRQKNKQGTYQDDILAADYMAPGTWAKIAERLRLEQPPDYDSSRNIANKLSAHLTYSRVSMTAGGPTPPSAAVHEYLQGVAAVWLASLPPDRRVWFGGAPG